jgi:hypothetical protein
MQRSSPAREIDGGVWRPHYRRAPSTGTNDQHRLWEVKVLSARREQWVRCLEACNTPPRHGRFPFRFSLRAPGACQALRAEADCKVTETTANKAATEAARTANWLASKSKKDEARDAKNKKKGVGSVIFVGNLRSDSRFVFPQSILVIHEQEAAAGCAEKKPSASKERKASAKIWRCGDSLCKA